MPEKMKRTQIYLEPELDEDLSRLAARRGVSKAQLLREGAYRIVREDRAAEEDSIASPLTPRSLAAGPASGVCASLYPRCYIWWLPA